MSLCRSLNLSFFRSLFFHHCCYIYEKISKGRFQTSKQIGNLCVFKMFMVTFASLVVIPYQTTSVISTEVEAILEPVPGSGRRLMQAPDYHLTDISLQSQLFPEDEFCPHAVTTMV